MPALSLPGRTWLQISRVCGLLTILTVLAACGCGYERVVFDDVLESDCDPPCWRGIIPGETDRQQVPDLLKQPPETDPSVQRMDWGWLCFRGHGMTQVSIDLDSDDLTESITLVDPDRGYTFQRGVEEFGPPAFVLMTPCAPDTDEGFLYLVYPERGLAFGSGYLPAAWGRPWQQPSPETRVWQWVYFAPMQSAAFPPRGGPIHGCGMSYANETVAWQGFKP
jgi:hypothetical protein